jgi:hypothetical protein
MALCTCLLGTAGCATTPEEITRIQVENALLREQVRIIRENCSYYRDLRIEAEEEPETP